MRYTYWQHEDLRLGYLDEFSDYRTQGGTFDELQKNLRDLYEELMSGTIPEVRRTAELRIG